MKRYKLIKSYPGSPKLGVEVIYSETHQIYNYNGGDYYTELPKHQVENLPEFWEEVVEKVELKYEILEFKNKSGDIFSLDSDGRYYYKTWKEDGISGFTLAYLLVSDISVINKIKVLSTGEVFTIGDKIVWDWAEHDLKYLTITGFTTTSNDIIVNIHHHVYNSNTCFSDLIRTGENWNFRHYKVPVFTTYDGVELSEYGKDILYWVYEKKNGWIIGNEMKINSNSTTYCCKHIFYSKEKAEEFIESKKVLFTTEDGVNITKGMKTYYLSLMDLKAGRSEQRALSDSCEHEADNNGVGLFFYSKEAGLKYAQEYVSKIKEEKLLDSKCLSYNEVIKFIEDKCMQVFDIDSEEEMDLFKELVKSKQ